MCRRPGSRLTSPRARQRRHASPACTTRLPWSSAFVPSARTVVGLCAVGRVATFTFLADCSALQRREVFAMGFSAAPSAPSSRKVYLWVLYCRVYSATAFKHSLVGFPPRAPLLRVVELLPLPLRAGGFHRACWADVLCASSHHHSIYGIVSHAPAMIPPLFAGLPDASSPLPRLCWPGL